MKTSTKTLSAALRILAAEIQSEDGIANAAIAESERLKDVIKETIEDNLDLADGENCTLIKLKRSISYDDLQPLTDEEIAFQRWCD